MFIYNEESILNNPISRWVNVIIMTIITLIFIGNEAMPPTITYWGLAFIIIFSSLCISYCYSRTMSKTHFFEDDKRERDKKDKFSVIYILISSVLSCAPTCLCASSSYPYPWRFLLSFSFLFLFFSSRRRHSISSAVSFFFQAEDVIRALVRSRVLGDVYKLQQS